MGAHEKANEILVKTDHDFNLEKQTLVHNGRMRLKEEYAKKEHDYHVQRLVDRSQRTIKSRNDKMTARHDLLMNMFETAKSRLDDITRKNEYPTLLKDLIIQGIFSLEANTQY